MAYSDNYPNGYKSGYNSWDDPDRRDYSPYGEERARRNAMAGSDGMSEYEAGRERERQRIRQMQIQREWEENQRIRERKNFEEHLGKRSESISWLADQKRNQYKQKSLFARAWLTLKGQGYYKTNFWELAKKEIDGMDQRQLDDFYRRNVR